MIAGRLPCVGFDARLWHHTGIGRYIRNLTAQLRDIDLVVWARPEDVELLESELPHATVRCCPARPFSLQEFVFWRRELREVPLDLFHAPHINVPFPTQVPLVVTLHDLIPLRFPGTINSRLGEIYFAMMSNLAVARAARVIAVSTNTQRDLVRLLDADARRIRIIAEGADPRFGQPTSPAQIESLRQRFGIQGRYILYAGQWKRYKNLETLLQAFALLRRQHGDLKLVLVGRQDPRQPHVPGTIRALGIESDVIRTGYLTDESDLVGLYQGAAVLAFPSRYEGFGLPPLEAMAAGVPVVASDAASLPEVISDAGLLIPPDDLDQWVATLDRVLTDASLRQHLIAAGHRRVRTLTWDRTAQLTLATYREVLRGSPTAAPAPSWAQPADLCWNLSLHPASVRG